MVLGVLTSQILTLAKSHAHLKGGPSPSPQGCPWWLAMSQHACPVGRVAPSWACQGKLGARPLWVRAALAPCQLGPAPPPWSC